MNPGISGASMMNRVTQRFGSPSFVDGSKEFVSSNSMVAKVAFLLLIVLLFVYLLRVGSVLISWFLQPSGSPYLVSGMKNAKSFRRITQDPAKKGSITVLRSKNEYDGLEFTYSTWMYIDDLDYNKVEIKIDNNTRDLDYLGNKSYGVNLPIELIGLEKGLEEIYNAL